MIQKPQKGFTLVEALIISTIALILAMITFRTPFGWYRDVETQRLAHTLESRLYAASQFAMLSGYPVTLRRENDSQILRFTYHDGTRDWLWYELDIRPPFRIGLPDVPLDHPTLNQSLNQAWPNTSAWRFRAQGQTGGTIVVTEGKRAFCVVVSANGQFRTFVWRWRTAEWTNVL